MQQRNSQVIIILSAFIYSSSVLASLSFESSAKNAKKTTSAVSEKKINPAALQEKSATLELEKSIEKDDAEKIKASLVKYDLILTQEKKLDNIISLKFNRIVCFIQLARLSRIKGGGKTLVQEEEKYLKTALSIIDEVLSINHLSEPVRSQMYYFKGLSYLDLGLKEKSRTFFLKAIATYPNSKFVTTLSLYLADLLYDERQLPEAIVAYRKFYSQMNAQEKDLADYKVAWIYLNQSDLNSSINLFLDLVNRSTSESMVSDSILSLSVAFSEKNDQESILAKLEQMKTTEKHKLEILSAVYENFLKQPEKERAKILAKILSFKTGGETIVRLIITELEFLKLADISTKEIFILKSIQKYFSENLTGLMGVSRPLVNALANEIERLVAKSLQLYLKEKTETRLHALRLAIDIYLKPKTFERHVEVVSLLIDLLSEINENSQLMSWCTEVLENPQYQSLRSKVKLLVLLDYEKKYLNNPVENQEKFFNLVKVYLKDLKAEQWESVALKFSEYLVKANRYNEAEEVVSILNLNNPKEDIFLKLILIKFELKKCEEIITLLSEKKQVDDRLLDYKRECHLVIAQDSKNNYGSSSQYQESILKFISLSKGAKKNAAIADYMNSINQLTDDRSVALYQSLLENHFYNYRFEKEIFPIFEKEILLLVEKGELVKALFYLKDCQKHSVCSSLASLTVELQQVIYFDRIQNQNTPFEQKLHGNVEKYLSLIRPEILIFLFSNEIHKTSIDRQILLVASRLSMLDWADLKFKNVYSAIADLLSKEEKLYIFAPSWVRFNKINLPKSNDHIKLSDQDILYLMKRVQNTREIVLSDLGKLSTAAQKVILTKAIETEQRMAELIKLSPIPKDLEVTKVNEYRQGLKQLSEEFEIQSSTYKKSLTNLEKQKSDLNLNSLENLKMPIEIEQWPWGTGNIYEEKLKQLVKTQNYMQAIFYLDYLLSVSKIKIEDYYAQRSGVLLFSANNRKKPIPMIKYVWEECESNKQDKILKEWQERSKK